MSEHFPFSPWQQKRLRAFDEAQARNDARVAENAFWAAKASAVAASEKAERERDRRGRTEVIGHMLRPGAAADAVRARIRAGLSVTGDREYALPNKIVWAPIGLHETVVGQHVELDLVDEQSARNIQTSFAARTAAGEASFIDFVHNNGAPAAQVRSFEWDPARGILAALDWSELGAACVARGDFVYFSPTYRRDCATGRMIELAAGYEVGSLTNTPGLLKMPAIVAAAAARASLADVVRDAMSGVGYPESAVNFVRLAIEDGRDPEAIARMIKTLS